MIETVHWEIVKILLKVHGLQHVVFDETWSCLGIMCPSAQWPNEFGYFYSAALIKINHVKELLQIIPWLSETKQERPRVLWFEVSYTACFPIIFQEFARSPMLSKCLPRFSSMSMTRKRLWKARSCRAPWINSSNVSWPLPSLSIRWKSLARAAPWRNAKTHQKTQIVVEDVYNILQPFLFSLKNHWFLSNM